MQKNNFKIHFDRPRVIVRNAMFGAKALKRLKAIAERMTPK